MKTWTITTEHTVLTRITVEGNTEEEALKNYEDLAWAKTWKHIDQNQVDDYEWEVVGIEKDIAE